MSDLTLKDYILFHVDSNSSNHDSNNHMILHGTKAALRVYRKSRASHMFSRWNPPTCFLFDVISQQWLIIIKPSELKYIRAMDVQTGGNWLKELFTPKKKIPIPIEHPQKPVETPSTYVADYDLIDALSRLSVFVGSKNTFYDIIERDIQTVHDKGNGAFHLFIELIESHRHPESKLDRKSTRLNSSHSVTSRMPSSA